MCSPTSFIMRNKQLFRATMISVVAAALGGGLQGCSPTQDAPTAVVPAVAAPPKAAAALDAVKPVMACADLAMCDLGAIGGAGSKIIAAVETTNQAGQSICAVEGTLSPAINFTVQLPMQHWTQRSLQIGCGGLCGSIAGNVGAADGCAPLNSGGFVLAATNMGHQDQDGAFGKDAGKRADFACRGQHLTAVYGPGDRRADAGVGRRRLTHHRRSEAVAWCGTVAIDSRIARVRNSGVSHRVAVSGC